MHAMAQEASESSVASSSSTANWWDMQANSLTTNWNRWQTHNHHSASSCEEDISISNASFTNASNNHSGLSMDSSAAGDLAGEPGENQLWSQMLLRAGNVGEMNQNHIGDDRENFLEVLSSKSLCTHEMYNPACDYLKKMDNAWGFGSNPPSFNSLDKQISSYDDHGELMAHQRLANLSELVSNWSIAPPNPQLDSQIINPPMDQFSTSNLLHIKHELADSTSYPGNGMVVRDRNAGYLPSYMHGEGNHQESGANLEDPFARPAGIRYEIGLNNSVIGLQNKFCSTGVADVPWSNTRDRDISDIISFKPVDFRTSKLAVKGSSSSDSKKQGCETSSSSRGSGRSNGTTGEGKKKRSEDNPETIVKKSKHESSTASSSKLQVPKVKLTDRITPLQQIVSPFGKTDTASVLLEAIKCIRFLHEQVQLLSDPYLKSGANKQDHNSWGGLERNEQMEQKLDLRSRGLCLVPISCTPQVYRDSTGPDYWTPTYRGCLYR